jgi:hypothetical protein
MYREWLEGLIFLQWWYIGVVLLMQVVRFFVRQTRAQEMKLLLRQNVGSLIGKSRTLMHFGTDCDTMLPRRRRKNKIASATSELFELRKYKKVASVLPLMGTPPPNRHATPASSFSRMPATIKKYYLLCGHLNVCKSVNRCVHKFRRIQRGTLVDGWHFYLRSWRRAGQRVRLFGWVVLILYGYRAAVSLHHSVHTTYQLHSFQHFNRFNHDKRHLQEMSLHVLQRGVHSHLLSRVTH